MSCLNFMGVYKTRVTWHNHQTWLMHSSLSVTYPALGVPDMPTPMDTGTASVFARTGAGRSSEVERSLMVRWVVGSILHGVDPLSYFSFQPVLHDWCNKGRGMCYSAYKRTLAVNRKE